MADPVARDTEEKLIFVCNLIKDSKNVTEYQRATLLAQNFRAAIVHRMSVPETVRNQFQEAHRVRGRVLSVVHGVLLIAYLRLKGYKIVHTSPEIFAIIWGLLAKHLLGCVWIYDLWDHPSLELATGRPSVTWAKRLLFNTFVWKRVADADGWIIAMHGGVLDHLPRPSAKTKIIEVTNGVDLSIVDDVLKSAPDILARRDEAFLEVSYVGPVTLLRGMSVVLQSLDSLDDRHRVRTNLAGRSDEGMVEMIADHNRRSPHQVRYLGYLDHAEALLKLAQSDVCLCILDPSVLSYNYSYNLKVFEYLALGKVVIASHTAAFSEIIQDGENGFLVSYSAEDLREVFERIIGMKEKGDLVRIQREARKTAELYRWEDINDKVLAGVHSLLASHEALR